MPGANDKTKLCELFIPYQHSMTQFYSLIESLFKTPVPIQQSSLFLETMEDSLLKRRQLINNKQQQQQQRLGKNNVNNIHMIMNSKKATTMNNNDDTNAKKQCKPGSHTISSRAVDKMKKTYCEGHNHIDLSNNEIKNIAVHYLQKDISNEYQNYMISLKQVLRYEIVDENCPSAPLFKAKDISIQQVAMDTVDKGKKEWVAVVNLNSLDDNSYLQHELPRCMSSNYLIGTNINVKAYIDNNNCCEGLVDFKECMETRKKCKNKLYQLKNDAGNDYSKIVKLQGTHYDVTDDNSMMHRRRKQRMLLSSNNPHSGHC
jgi:hypothetical protein